MAETDKPEISSKGSSDPKENTRSRIAMIYVCAFFIVIAIVFVIGFLKCFKVDEYKDMLVTVSGVLSGPLGFIVGYYFKILSYWWIDLKNKRLWKFWKVSGNDLEIVLISVFYSLILMRQLFLEQR